MMRAVVYEKYGPPEVLHLQEVEKPAPRDNEVLIRVHASTVTTGDVNVRGFTFVPAGFGFIARLMFGLTGPKKTILGLEFAGEVEAAGRNVRQFRTGDRVFGIDGVNLGAYAEYKCMAEDGGLTIMPVGLTYEETAAIPNGALTALTFLRDMGKVQNGQKVLVNGASGSVGSAAVQIARHYGAEVTGVCSTANMEMVRSLGADKVIDYTREDFTGNGEMYDIIFDTVGKTLFSGVKSSLKQNGLYLAGSGGLREMLQMGRTSMGGGRKVMAGASSERKEDLIFIKELVEKGKIKPVIDRTYALEQIVEAHRYVDTGRKKGNVVIKVAGGHR
jgi:NADPH:quinone reductase-like Zn-dependent oxidoreductase